MSERSTCRFPFGTFLVLLLGIALGVGGVSLYHAGILGSHATAQPPIDVAVTTPPAQGGISAPAPLAQANPNAPNTPSLFDDGFFASPFDKDNWDPFQEMQRVQERMDKLFNESLGRFHQSPRFSGLADDFTFSPDLDLRDDGNAYVVRMDLPGADKPEVNVEVEGTTLKVTGKRDETIKEEDKGKVLRNERREGAFERSIQLPGEVKAEEVVAKYENGVLTITLPKAETPSQSHRIEIR